MTAFGLSKSGQNCDSFHGQSPQSDDHADAEFSVIWVVSDIRVFRHFQRVIHLNSEVAHCTFQFGMSE